MCVNCALRKRARQESDRDTIADTTSGPCGSGTCQASSLHEAQPWVRDGSGQLTRTESAGKQVEQSAKQAGHSPGQAVPPPPATAVPVMLQTTQPVTQSARTQLNPCNRERTEGEVTPPHSEQAGRRLRTEGKCFHCAENGEQANRKEKQKATSKHMQPGGAAEQDTDKDDYHLQPATLLCCASDVVLAGQRRPLPVDSAGQYQPTCKQHSSTTIT